MWSGGGWGVRAVWSNTDYTNTSARNPELHYTVTNDDVPLNFFVPTKRMRVPPALTCRPITPK